MPFRLVEDVSESLRLRFFEFPAIEPEDPPNEFFDKEFAEPARFGFLFRPKKLIKFVSESVGFIVQRARPCLNGIQKNPLTVPAEKVGTNSGRRLIGIRL